jgi:hypothetical protein
MTNTLVLAESVFCWHAANYGVCTDTLRATGQPAGTAARQAKPGWLICVALRGLLAALLLAWVGGFAPACLWLAGCMLGGSLILPLTRLLVAPGRLAEFELGANGIFVLCAWLIAANSPLCPSQLQIPGLNSNQMSAICVAIAILIFMIRGGDLFVRGILEKAGGMPAASDAESGVTYNHGKVIGQVERLIVVLIVMAGNLQALAFFFAAKGLIRSKELNERPIADYFLLGSLGSFLIALAGGLISQETLKQLWK